MMQEKRKWNESEVELLISSLEKGMSAADIAALLRRSAKSVNCKINKLHLSKLEYKSKQVKQNYYPIDVKCPFFMIASKNTSKHKRLICEGVNQHTSLSLQFADEGKWKEYMTKYCNNGWSDCLIAKMLAEKYED
ncbi:MAG: hypothetical protein NC110_05785 [Ruminococcus sp.]|nr:hypothetical protein [Ruminococcus sp.]